MLEIDDLVVNIALPASAIHDVSRARCGKRHRTRGIGAVSAMAAMAAESSPLVKGADPTGVMIDGALRSWRKFTLGRSLRLKMFDIP